MKRRAEFWAAAATLLAIHVLLAATAAQATPNAEEACQRDRLKAAAKYTQCHQNALGVYYSGPNSFKLNDSMSKCLIKYAKAWDRLRARASGKGGTCDQTRFTDSGVTVTDNLTGLQWEKKTDDNSVHDKDNTYTWSSGDTQASGPAFTTFLSALNAPSCFAGQCDWRLPTLAELQSIVPGGFTCATSPCIDPVFGPTTAGEYWSATSRADDLPHAMTVNFNGGGLGFALKNFFSLSVRAVRGGL